MSVTYGELYFLLMFLFLGKVRARSHRRSQRSTWKQTGTSSSANNCPSRLATVKVVLVPDPNQPELKKLAKVVRME